MTNIEKILLITIALNIKFNLCLNQHGCLVTFKPNLIVKSDADSADEILPGNYVEDYQGVTYSCGKGHLLKGDSEATNFCLDSKWSKPMPECQKPCRNSVLLSATIQSTCVRDRIGVSCRRPILPGTRATISCQFGYQKTDIDAHDHLYCGDDGEWDYTPYRCKQVCGKVHPDFQPFLLGGTKTNNTKVPWHVAIYSNLGEPNHKICGGTIVNARIVISAAHCFWNTSNSQVNDKSLYKVGAGKYYRDYNAREPLEVQFSDIAEIHIPKGYQDELLFYINDIAVLVLKTYLHFTYYIKPVCINWKPFSEKAMKSNAIGRVAGWGYTDKGLANSELNIVELTTLSYVDCVDKAPKEYKNLITVDKFCIASKDDQTICEGESGSGFVIPVEYTNGAKRFTLQGILSNGINSNAECTGDFLTAYTNIQYFQHMIDSYMDQYKVY